MTTNPTGIGGYYPDAFPAQTPSDVAVVMPTMLRPEIAAALASVYAQDFQGRIQVVIGVDVARHDAGALEQALAGRPDQVSALVLRLPHSTSRAHGGVHLALDGGALRSILSFMANSPFVAFLDDDNTWAPRHLSLLRAAIEGKVWACTQRMLVDSESGADLGVDRWDSVGAGRGRFASLGGFVDPNTLMVDKVKAARALGRWAETLDGKPGLSADRHFFRAIAQADHAYVMEPTVRYKIRPTNVLRRFLRENVSFASG